MLERFVIGALLPKETSFANWKILNDLKNQLAGTEEEIKLLGLQEVSGQGITAQWLAVPEKEITFGQVAEKWVVDALKDLDKKEKLLPEQLTIYEKFVLPEAVK